MVLTARGFVALGFRSEDVLSKILVVRHTHSPGPYECKTKADCQKHIEYVNHEIQRTKAKAAE